MDIFLGINNRNYTDYSNRVPNMSYLKNKQLAVILEEIWYNKFDILL